MGPLRLPQVRAYAACMETLAFVGRDLSPGETLVRVIITLVDSIHDGGLETPPTKSVGKLGSPKVMGVLLTSGPPPSMPRSAMPERRGTLQA
jgi:hypothetical protein